MQSKVRLLTRLRDRIQFAKSLLAWGEAHGGECIHAILDRARNEAPGQKGLGPEGCGAFGRWLRCASGHRAAGYAPLRAPRHRPKSPQQTVFYPGVWSVYCLLAFLALVPGPLRAAEEKATAAWLAEHYVKFEFRIPMRDGVRLFTCAYAPKDDSQTWPILLTRTPYALKPYGADNYGQPSGSFESFARDKFILVTQDVRGRYGSEGQYVHVRPFNPEKGPKEADESSDTWDTIDWLVKNVPGNNGKVGLFGISYPGFYTVNGNDRQPSRAQGRFSAGAHMDWFMGDDLHHNGAFFLTQNFGFILPVRPARSGPAPRGRGGLSVPHPRRL